MSTHTTRLRSADTSRRIFAPTLAMAVWFMAPTTTQAQFAAGEIPVTGASSSAFAGLDTDIKDFMVANNITAVTVGVMKGGRVVYERGFGWRDYYGGNLTPIKSNNVMRVASVTKPIIAAAIQKLITDEVISPTDKVFAFDQAPGVGILPADPYAPYNGVLGDDRIKNITVQDLILHRGGFDRNAIDANGVGDPQFGGAVPIVDALNEILDPDIDYPPGPVYTVQYMLSQPLRFTPGASTGMCNSYAWGTAVTYTVGTNPRAVAVSDLDGDGYLDLATANNGSDDVSVVLGNGDGTFAAAVNYPAGNGPHGIAIGDLDGDTFPDLVVANQLSDNVSVLLNNGNGTFAAAITTSTGDSPRGLLIADVNGDGMNDVVTANSGSDNVSLLRGNGDGTLTSVLTLAVGTSPYAVAFGNMDNAQLNDLVTANYGSNNVSVLLSSGGGSFNAAVNYSVGTSPFAVALNNLDGQNRQDVITANETSGDISVLLNDGNGILTTSGTYAAGTKPRSLVLGNFDANSGTDIAASNENSHNITILSGNGDGTFGSPTTLSTGNNPRGIASGDFDGNSTSDLVTAHSSSTNAYVLLRAGDGDYCYSNFGFMLLGLIINEVAVVPHPIEYIQDNFLDSWGAAPSEMFPGRTFKDEQDPREPIYEHPNDLYATNVFDPTGPEVLWPYGGWEQEVWLGHGDLVTNTVQILNYADRYLVFTDYNNLANEIGMPLSVASVPFDNYGHEGSAPGTNAVALQNKNSDLRIAAIINQREFIGELRDIIYDYVNDAGFTYPAKYATDNWVDFASGSNGTGTFTSPKNDLSDMLANGVQAGGRIKFKPGSGNWTGTINQSVKLDAPLGSVTIGQ